MPANERRLPLRNGEPRKLPRGCKRLASVTTSRHAEVTVVVRSRGGDDAWRKLYEELTAGLPGQRRYLTRAELGKQWGAAPADLAAVRKFGAAHGLKTVSSDAFRRCVVLSGPIDRIGRAFSVEFVAVQHPLGTFRSHRRRPLLPESIHSVVECVLGLDDLPSAETHLTILHRDRVPRMDRKALLAAYRVPSRLHGKGECVAVIELGGGLHKRDFRRYFEKLRLPAPRLRVRQVGGAKNDPADPADIRKVWAAMENGHFSPCKPFTFSGNPAVDAQAEWTIETTMDLQIAGTVAPQASLLLIQAPGNDQGQYHAITAAIADGRNAPSVLSCSWGSNERTQTPALMLALDRWFQAAAVLGMTVCFSSGDRGDGTMCDPPGKKTFCIEFPACSPHVLAVGGTTLEPKAGTETAWKQDIAGLPMSGGGGFSSIFALPPWQQKATIDPAQWLPAGASSGDGRAIPDVAAKADYDTAFSVIVGGTEVCTGGTSASVPFWGGLIAVLNQGLKGRAGSINPLLYDGTLDAGIRDITKGDTGFFHAEKGWDPCTGWGSPDGEALLRALRGQPKPRRASAPARSPRRR